MKKNNKGFSLVELIVVVLIMAIIATALTLAVTKYVAKSKRSSDANTAGELKTAAETAVTDYLTTVDDLAAGSIVIDGSTGSWVVTPTTLTLTANTAGDTFTSIFTSAAGSSAPKSKVHPAESFKVTIVVDDKTNATYSVSYSGTNSTKDIFAEATK